MRKRDLRVGLHVKRICDDGEEHGVTMYYNGRFMIQWFSVYGGEGFTSVEHIVERSFLRRLKLVDRVYDPHER